MKASGIGRVEKGRLSPFGVCGSTYLPLVRVSHASASRLELSYELHQSFYAIKVSITELPPKKTAVILISWSLLIISTRATLRNSGKQEKRDGDQGKKKKVREKSGRIGKILSVFFLFDGTHTRNVT